MKHNIIILLGIFFLSAFNSNAQFGKTIVSLKGVVLDEADKSPAKVLVQAKDKDGNVIGRANSNSATGEYFLTGLEQGNIYTIVLSGDEHLATKFDVEIPETDKYAEYSRDFLATKKEKGKQLPLKIIPFDNNKSKLRAGADIALDDIITLLLENPRIRFTVHSYPDSDADNAFNQELTNQRAEVIREFMLAKDIKPIRIKTKGYAEIDPKNPLPTKKQAKGKRYKGNIYITFDSM